MPITQSAGVKRQHSLLKTWCQLLKDTIQPTGDDGDKMEGADCFCSGDGGALVPCLPVHTGVVFNLSSVLQGLLASYQNAHTTGSTKQVGKYKWRRSCLPAFCCVLLCAFSRQATSIFLIANSHHEPIWLLAEESQRPLPIPPPPQKKTLLSYGRGVNQWYIAYVHS